MTFEALPLVATAATLGAVHTLLGPDHYVPFVALARERSWSLPRTLAVTAVCGIGHVAGSILLGALGIGLGWALSGLVAFEGFRGTFAGWLLLGVGLAYTVWGVRRALRGGVRHAHLHAHADGTLHLHEHDHRGGHGHPHERHAQTDSRRAFGVVGRWLGPWSLFVVFVLGPCEPLIPLLLYPAAEGSPWTVALVAATFATTTLLTMLSVVAFAVLGLSRLPDLGLERWTHALAGAALALCGVAVTLGF